MSLLRVIFTEVELTSHQLENTENCVVLDSSPRTDLLKNIFLNLEQSTGRNMNESG